ncbi:lysophospholipid acyltransferase family protein [Mycoplasmopsis sturni]|uniref:lysophospholipid acyltransferase family protein n=1 Tax=Mycoplasmopsis sturni TaxID=39047 RepID=UPI00068A7734|nr:lysophospholipid acyltransferase family protein [Mycoplasmopsis sturni]
MKKPTVNITLKKIIFALPWLFRARKIISTYRKYKRDPEGLGAQFRNDYYLKLAKKALQLYNVDLVVKGYEDLPKNSAILVPNHKSYADLLALFAALEKQTEDVNVKNPIATFVAKEELNDNFWLKRIMYTLNTFTIQRDNFRDYAQKMNAFGDFVKNNRTLGVVFPEGTRIKGNKLGEFKSGAFKIAKNNFLPVVPVAIDNAEAVFEKNRKGRVTVTVTFLKPIKPVLFMSQEPKGMAAQVRALIAKELKIDNE